MVPLVFFGSSIYSVIILQKLINTPDFKISLIVSKTDKPLGRNQKITPNPVAQFALDHQLPLLQVDQFDRNSKLEINNYYAVLGLCVAFGPPFFDEDLINLFPHGIVNIHPSPLPRYRGATPGPWQIINGETSSAVTYFQIDLLPDHGPIIAQIPFDIAPTETADSFYQKAFRIAAGSLSQIINSYLNSPQITPQDHSQKTYFPKLNKDLAQINWQQTPPEIDRFVRAMIPWPIAWTLIADKKNKLLKMKIFSFDVAKNEPQSVQIEGKKLSSWREIRNYYTIIRQITPQI